MPMIARFKPFSTSLAVCLLGATLLAATLPAHGGAYRGPLPSVPGPTTPGGPTTGGPGSRTTGASGSTDRTRWQLWWEFNKDAYLRRRPGEGGVTEGGIELPSGLPVTLDHKRNAILPALRRLMRTTSNRDITSSCMVALAKIGIDHEDFQILPLLSKQLRRGDQEIRETAALALGIAQRTDAIPLLQSLLHDTSDGHRLMQQERVDDRTRAFAAYGLGVIATGTPDLTVKNQVFEALVPLLADGREDDRDVLVAVINAIRLVDPSPEKGPRHVRLAWRCLAALEDYLRLDLGVGRQVIQAHVAPALARILGRGDTDDHHRVKRGLAEALLGRDRRNATLAQSAALALGVMVAPREERDADAVYATALRRAIDQHRDVQVRYFSTLALGQIGGEANLQALTALWRDSKGADRSWAALALGLLAHHAPEVTGQQGPSVAQRVGTLLVDGLDTTRNPEDLSAHAVALGLAGHRSAAEQLRTMLKKYRNQQELAGYLCVGLALMDDRHAIPLMVDILRDARRRPVLMAQAAVALARLQERGAAEVLHPMLRRTDHQSITLAAAASALGWIGDDHSVEPLLKVVGAEKMPKLLRAFAVASIGMIADHDWLPWNAAIARDMNYRAMVGTLSNGASGVLDIL